MGLTRVSSPTDSGRRGTTVRDRFEDSGERVSSSSRSGVVRRLNVEQPEDTAVNTGGRCPEYGTACGEARTKRRWGPNDRASHEHLRHEITKNLRFEAPDKRLRTGRG